jgi:hypothetical protein
VRIPPHHVRALPASQLLQREHRRAVLHVPAGPRMPQIMPAKIGDSCPLERRISSLGAHLGNRLASKAEHVRRVRPELLSPAPPLPRSMHRDRLARLRLIGMHPRQPPRQIHLRPLQSGHVGIPPVLRTLS